MRPSQTILVLEDLSKSLTGPLYRKGVELSLNDDQTVREVYQQWILLTVDLGYLHPATLKRDAHRLLSSMLAMDVLDLNNAFAEILHLLRCQEYKGFKALCSRISSHLYNLVKDDFERILRGDVHAAKRLMQLCSYTSRLSLKEVDLTQQCLEDYMKIEDEMPEKFNESFLSSLNNVIKRWMKPFDPSLIHCQHGPGGVAGHGRTSLEVKYKDLTYDAKLVYAFGPPTWVVGPLLSTCDRISKTIFVAKSYKTFRTISMEPSTLMYFQQGIWKEVDRVVSDSSYLRNRIGFHRQERNQRLAQEGSINRTYATLDLSAASDSVSYSLVKRVFRGTKLLRFIVATRSGRTLLPNGRLVTLKKFAPMGSALCFPIETIIFAAICHQVTREFGVSDDFSVFGDDIIVPTQCAERMMEVLDSLGFRVNREKSFFRSNHWFRESCGAEYCDGFDVTPLRVSRKYYHILDDVQVSGLVDLANKAYIRGFRNLRAFFLRKLRASNFKPLFAPHALLSDNYTNYQAKQRWNPHLQRTEVDASRIKLSKPKKQDESIRLRHWLETSYDRRRVVEAFVSRIDRPTKSLQDHWYPAFDALIDHQDIELDQWTR